MLERGQENIHSLVPLRPIVGAEFGADNSQVYLRSVEQSQSNFRMHWSTLALKSAVLFISKNNLVYLLISILICLSILPC